MSTTYEIGKKLVELCSQGKNLEAISTLYSPSIISLEAHSGPDMPARYEGIQAVKGKNEWWVNNHTIHSAKAEGPWPHGDKFIVRFTYDITPKAGPHTGKRMTIDEAGLYTVKDGKIVQEEFFYHMG